MASTIAGQDGEKRQKKDAVGWKTRRGATVGRARLGGEARTSMTRWTVKQPSVQSILRSSPQSSHTTMLISRCRPFSLQTRAYAAVASRPARPSGRRKLPSIGLDHVTYRVIVDLSDRPLIHYSSFRDSVCCRYGRTSSELSTVCLIIRTCSGFSLTFQDIPPSPTRDELHRYARAEFERNRNVTDLVSLNQHPVLLHTDRALDTHKISDIGILACRLLA